MNDKSISIRVSHICYHGECVMEVLTHVLMRNCHLDIHCITCLLENNIYCQSPVIGENTHKRNQLSFSNIFSEDHFESIIFHFGNEGFET